MKRTLISLSLLIIASLSSLNSLQAITLRHGKGLAAVATIAATSALGIYTGAKWCHDSLQKRYPNPVATFDKYANYDNAKWLCKNAAKAAGAFVLGNSAFHSLKEERGSLWDLYYGYFGSYNRVGFALITAAACSYGAWLLGKSAYKSIKNKIAPYKHNEASEESDS